MLEVLFWELKASFVTWTSFMAKTIKEDIVNTCKWLALGFRIRVHLIQIRIRPIILGWIPIRIQSGSRVFMTKYWKKFTAEKFLIKNYNLPIPRPPYRTSKLQKKPSALKRKHPALQNMKFLNFFYFCGSFLPSWIHDPLRIRIRNPGLCPLFGLSWW